MQKGQGTDIDEYVYMRGIQHRVEGGKKGRFYVVRSVLSGASADVSVTESERDFD